MKKIFVVFVASVILGAGGLFATSILSQTALGKLNCDSNSCSGGSGYGAGGAGGHFQIDQDGTYTQSGGGGSKFLPGGGGGHTVCDSNGCVSHGGSSGP
jgi:hypothetical protein